MTVQELINALLDADRSEQAEVRIYYKSEDYNIGPVIKSEDGVVYIMEA